MAQTIGPGAGPTSGPGPGPRPPVGNLATLGATSTQAPKPGLPVNQERLGNRTGEIITYYHFWCHSLLLNTVLT